jgi:hypothetical protein
MRFIKLTLLLLCLSGCHALMAHEQKNDSRKLWRVSLESPAEGQPRRLNIENDDFLARFEQGPAWTIREMRHRGHQIGSPTGGTGAVIQWESNDPYVSAADIPDWTELRKFLLGTPDEPPSLAARLKKILPPGRPEQREIPAETLKALNTAMDDPNFFEDSFLNSLPPGNKDNSRAYAGRELRELRKAGARDIASHNRRLLDFALGKRVRPLLQTIGTVHGGEYVSGLTLNVDGREFPIVADGKLAEGMDSARSGERIQLKKNSVIGPFKHEALFEFNADDGLMITHRFAAGEDIKKGHFAGYRYTFMFMMPEVFDRWLPLSDDGRGTPEITGANPKPQTHTLSPFKALVCYAPEWRTGVAYVYPETYPGAGHIDVRSGKDRKFRASLLADSQTEGRRSEFRIRVIPFEAAPDQWTVIGAAATANQTAFK